MHHVAIVTSTIVIRNNNDDDDDDDALGKGHIHSSLCQWSIDPLIRCLYSRGLLLPTVPVICISDGWTSPIGLA